MNENVYCFKRLRLVITVITVMMGCSFLTTVQAQGPAEHLVKGKIVDENNASLPGITILVANSTTGSVSDGDGNYSLILPNVNGQSVMIDGMRLEGSRRFTRPSTERGLDFLPYPFSERDNNPNTPVDSTN